MDNSGINFTIPNMHAKLDKPKRQTGSRFSDMFEADFDTLDVEQNL